VTGRLLTAHVAPGVVVLVIDVDTTVALADASEFAVASGGLTTVGRPLSVADVDLLRNAAAQADAAADDVEPARPHLSVVGGDQS
jgi:hypothetical protein